METFCLISRLSDVMEASSSNAGSSRKKRNRDKKKEKKREKEKGEKEEKNISERAAQVSWLVPARRLGRREEVGLCAELSLSFPLQSRHFTHTQQKTPKNNAPSSSTQSLQPQLSTTRASSQPSPPPPVPSQPSFPTQYRRGISPNLSDIGMAEDGDVGDSGDTDEDGDIAGEHNEVKDADREAESG